MKTRGFYEQEYATKREVVDIATQIASSLIDDSDEIKGTVLFFADLPSANLWTDKLWIVQQSSGSWLTLNYKQSGIYKFTIEGDDAVDVFINGTNVANHYGGCCSNEVDGDKC